ncbi:hypothetical protein ABT026_01530 [Streptomyces sp. NPDC002734]|uniref:hypothetical protein n=1 Tax=Streptomyces sp. NPDC002734 TaxID=3154426 RepID=UPI00331FAA3C
MGRLIGQIVVVVIAFVALLTLIGSRAGALEVGILTVLLVAALGLVVRGYLRRRSTARRT